MYLYPYPSTAKGKANGKGVFSLYCTVHTLLHFTLILVFHRHSVEQYLRSVLGWHIDITTFEYHVWWTTVMFLIHTYVYVIFRIECNISRHCIQRLNSSIDRFKDLRHLFIKLPLSTVCGDSALRLHSLPLFCYHIPKNSFHDVSQTWSWANFIINIWHGDIYLAQTTVLVPSFIFDTDSDWLGTSVIYTKEPNKRLVN